MLKKCNAIAFSDTEVVHASNECMRNFLNLADTMSRIQGIYDHCIQPPEVEDRYF